MLAPKDILNNSTALDSPRWPSTALEKTGNWLHDLFIAGRSTYMGDGTPAAQRAMQVLNAENVRWLRAEPGQFAMGLHNLRLAGVTLTPRVWTLRLCEILPEGFFRMTLWRDALPIDNAIGEVEEIFEGVTRDDKPALEMLANGGFVASFEPCHETEFRMVKGERE